MKHFYTFLILTTILSLQSCKTRLKTIETVRIDTIKVKEILKIEKPSVNTITLKDPCDSLGNLKPFEYKSDNGKVKLQIKTIKDTIYIQQNIDSIVDSLVEKEKIKFEKENKKEIIEKKIIPTWVYWLIGLNIVYLAYLIYFKGYLGIKRKFKVRGF
jgi:hypothetical protein